MSFSSPAKQKIASALGQYAANELEMMISGMGGPVVHLENEETILGRKMFSVSIGVNGISYSWPHENLVGVLVNDGDGNLSWRELTGSGTVTEVGLLAPPEFVVGDPVRSAGNLTFSKAVQQGGTVYAGPMSGGSGRPSFRKLVVSDIPLLPPEKVVKLQETLDQKVDVALVKRSREEIDDALRRKVENPVFLATTMDLSQKIGDLSRTKVDVAMASQSQAKIQGAVAQKVDREEIERRFEEIARKLDDVAKLLGEKVSTNAPKFQAAADVLDLNVADGSNLVVGHNKGTKIGSTRHQKLAFYGLPPVPQPSGDVITGLANLGLISNPSLWMSDIVGLVERIEALEARLGGD